MIFFIFFGEIHLLIEQIHIWFGLRGFEKLNPPSKFINIHGWDHLK